VSSSAGTGNGLPSACQIVADAKMMKSGQMVQRTVVQLTDDLDGSEAAETISLSLDSAQYEIDLNQEHAADLREVLAPYLGSARRVAGSRSAGSTGRTTARTSKRSDKQSVRMWAQEHGYMVSERGRISREVQEAYDAAH
jgi:hypothetical protein